MHWLIPLVTHSVTCLYGFLARTTTPTALVLSIIPVAAQSFHPWGGFYILFAIYFLLSNATASITARRGTTRTLLANAALGTIMVALHQLYLKERLKSVKWFQIMRAPAGCLPIPSPSLQKPLQYTFLDALGNQLPWGVLASYAAAMAINLRSSLGGPNSLSTIGALAGTLGATIVGLTAAYMLPLCDGRVPGAEEVMQSVDRSLAWEERNALEWSDHARYRALPGLVMLVGHAAMLAEGLVVHRFTSSSKVEKGKKKGKADAELVSTSKSDLTVFCTNAVITIGVILGMAVYSFNGAMGGESQHDILEKVRREQVGL